MYIFILSLFISFLLIMYLGYLRLLMKVLSFQNEISIRLNEDDEIN